ncbi:MAG: helix-turn-helix domain-containing protein [Gemmatimonadota bacterium]
MTSGVTTVDRRVQRTREALLHALRVLMAQRGYERLTIQNLLDHAGVGRATFYTHFSSKDDLLVTSVGGLRSWLVQRAAQRDGERLAFTLPFFQHLEGHAGLYRQCVRRGEVTVGREIRKLLRDLIRADVALQTGAGSDATSVTLMTEYLVGALWSTIAWWMASESPMSAVEVDRTFRRLVFSGLPGTVSELR